MKRLLPLMLMLTLLCGCAAKEPAAPETPLAPPASSSVAPETPSSSSAVSDSKEEDDALETVEGSIWSVTADGSLSPWEAAQVMAERIAENYRNVPDWVEWKPVDVQAGDTQVFDAYLAEPQQFCANFRLRVKVEDVTAARYGYWQAGAGLGEMDGEGYYAYGAQVLVAKNEEGDWVFCQRGTGGYRVILPRKEGEDNLELLVGDYFLTWGESHDWHIPCAILERSESEMAELPAILARRGQQEAKALCAALGKCLREHDYWEWSVETLKVVLGSYGDYLEA